MKRVIYCLKTRGLYPWPRVLKRRIVAAKMCRVAGLFWSQK